MINEIEIGFLCSGNEEKKISCPIGTGIGTVVHHFGNLASPLAAVKANDEILPLSARLEVNSRLEAVHLDSAEGVAIYRHSLAFLLAVAARKLFPERSLYIGHSLGNSYYYTFLEGEKLKKIEIDEQKNVKIFFNFNIKEPIYEYEMVVNG